MNTKPKSLNKKTKKQNPRRKRRTVRNQRIVSTQTVHISKCTRDFLAATVNPFKSNNDLPCIPDLTIIPSMKLKTLTRGTLSSGTAGYGWVQYNPWVAIAGDRGIANDDIDRPVVFTIATFAGNTTAFNVSGSSITTTGVSSANSNSPLTTASFQTVNLSKRYRLVAAGLRVRYVGANLRNQGTIYLYRTPDNGIMTANADAAFLLQDPYTSRLPVSRKTEYIFFSHASPDLTVYQPDTFFLPTSGGVSRMGCLTILIAGGDTEQPQSWDFEAVSYFELIGPNIATTPSHSDTSGFGAVLSALPSQAPLNTPETVFQTTLNAVGHAIKENASAVVNRVLPLAANAAVNYFTGGGMQMPALTGPTISEID